MKRVYESILKKHLTDERQMAFVSGPRQVGKTTVAENLTSRDCYINWDNQSHSQIILKGPEQIAETIGLQNLQKSLPVITFDEIHKYSHWKSFLKGFFDIYHKRCKIIVTGSNRLNVYKRGGDSLMGRYFIYRMMPLTIAETIRTEVNTNLISNPEKPDKDMLEALINFGGFPEPFLRTNTQFYNRWKKTRTAQLFYEDLRDTSRVHEIRQIEIMSQILTATAGSQINYSSIATDINASVDSVIRWIALLQSSYFCFELRPYHVNVPKSLRKQPKIYLYDWSLLTNIGSKNENFTAVHLKKAVDLWNDLGLGNFELFYLRDKEKREVDFLVTQNSQPWFMVEVKSSESKSLSKSLNYYHSLLKTQNAFQVSFDSEYIEKDCFQENDPIIVPWTTFFSQLV